MYALCVHTRIEVLVPPPRDGHMVLSIVLFYGQTATKCLGVTGVTFKSDEAPLCVLSLALFPSHYLFVFV